MNQKKTKTAKKGKYLLIKFLKIKGVAPINRSDPFYFMIETQKELEIF